MAGSQWKSDIKYFLHPYFFIYIFSKQIVSFSSKKNNLLFENAHILVIFNVGVTLVCIINKCFQKVNTLLKQPC